MPRRVLDRNGNITAVVYTRDELLALFRIDEEQLAEWSELIGPEGDEYSFEPAMLQTVADRVAVLKTGMSVDDVRGVEADGYLRGYAELAQDAPAGITAHVWRSYAVIVMYQTEQLTALNAYELAEIAQLKEINPLTGKFEESPALAKMHLRLLQGTHTEDGDKLLMMRDGTWEHHGLPLCLQRRKARQHKNG
jgi:hypothetical protein